MCVVIHLPKKKTLATKLLQNCYDRNHDGWGIMWAEGGVVHSVKDVSNFDAFEKAWKDVPRHAERGIHFRIKTHGSINQENCHPFLPVPTLGVMHNGVITTNMVEAAMSDTFNFVKYEVKPLIDGWNDFMSDPNFAKLIGEITGYSKLLFIDGAGNAVRTNEKAWHLAYGVAFSNEYSMREPYTAPAGASAGGYSQTYYPRDYDEDYIECYSASHRDTIRERIEVQRATYGGARCASGSITQLPLRALPAVIGKPEMEPKSDLYSGNKTDAEGQAYVARKEEERHLDTEVVDVDVVEADSDLRSAAYYDIDELMLLSAEELLDTVQDYPKEICLTLYGLLNTCVNAGVYKIDPTDIQGAVLKEEVVNTCTNNSN
jgi:Glutamine amidotransferases class-II